MIKKLDRKIFFKIYNYTSLRPKLSKTVVFLTKFSAKFFSVVYFTVLAALIYTQDLRIKQFILIPAFVYLLLKLIPYLYNRRRPFVEFKLENLIKQRADHSFPSTHSGSSLIIALAIFKLNPYLGVFFIITAFLTGVLRVMVGVHYPSDIIGAWLLSVTINLLAFQLLI